MSGCHTPSAASAPFTLTTFIPVPLSVIPAQAGIQGGGTSDVAECAPSWIPACAGMTVRGGWNGENDQYGARASVTGQSE